MNCALGHAIRLFKHSTVAMQNGKRIRTIEMSQLIAKHKKQTRKP